MGMYVLTCQPQASGPSVAPCYDIAGTAYAPAAVDLGGGSLDYAALSDFFGWALAFVLTAYVVGGVVGSVIRLIRSA